MLRNLPNELDFQGLFEFTAFKGLSLKGGTGNRGNGETGKPGIGESGKRGIGESGKRGIGETGMLCGSQSENSQF